ncbi:type II toxin-antitoxin system Phd/YefM family antitoxin [Phenylobacterium sp. 20VBR1]|uniref:Antitoxin n=1 Tax=Phenylobacterium glaciei TaxID=2803784 RepID=A0A941D006_9CAUL|nr:type II toxin-antitoxin system Phd/YefM family antitoxin [Phenylobacterium glaciei]MBR7619027.1 type II toxin-antitoxin system Phd/YefM family antitoxin [Phenylobacterium glaciei]QQZ51380.1 type II toxin-antitoxin system Phd/YefM family antitoxin [Phenylobacterium glaciei]
MSEHSVVEAKNNLSDLIDRALKGEAVVITRHGKPMVELKAVQPLPRRITEADIEWLRARRVGRKSTEDAGSLVSRMRDEDWR